MTEQIFSISSQEYFLGWQIEMNLRIQRSKPLTSCHTLTRIDPLLGLYHERLQNKVRFDLSNLLFFQIRWRLTIKSIENQHRSWHIGCLAEILKPDSKFLIIEVFDTTQILRLHSRKKDRESHLYCFWILILPSFRFVSSSSGIQLF